jgi:SNF2 family DNA or RNA helicase
MALLQSTQPERCILLSGTPIRNRIPEIYIPLVILTKGKLSTICSYRDFCRRFSFESVREFGGVKCKVYEGSRNEEELKGILKPRVIRRLAEDVLDLPEMVEIPVTVSGHVPTSYEDVVKQYLEDGKNTPQFVTVKREVSLEKARATAMYALEILESVEQILIFSDHIETVREISKILSAKKVKSAYMSSEVPTHIRDIHIRSFQNRSTQVLCSTIGVGSTGLNLQNCNTIIFNDFPFVPSDLLQAKKRIHRIGQKATCFYHMIVSNEIDRAVLQILNKKIETISKVMGGV